MSADRELCFECRNPAHHWHHVVPRSLGGTAMIALCVYCHSKVHRIAGTWKPSKELKRVTEDGILRTETDPIALSELVRRGLRRAKARGIKLGRPQIMQVEEILELRDKGFSYRYIVKKLKCGHGTIQRAEWIRIACGGFIPKPPPGRQQTAQEVFGT